MAVAGNTQAGTADDLNGRLFRRVAALSPDMVFVYDLTGDRTIFANPRTLEFTGLSGEEIECLGRGLLLRVVHPDDLPGLLAGKARQMAMDDICTAKHEYRVRRADGQWRWVRAREVVLERGDDGRIVQIMGIVEDITDERRRVEDLREAEARFAAMAEVSPVLMWIAGTDGRLEFCNGRLLDYTGRTMKELQRGRWMAAIPRAGRAAVDAIWRKAVAEGCEFSAEHLLTAADGTARWMLSRAMPCRDEEGRIVRWFGSSTDIDDQKRAAEALGEMNERLRLSIDTSGVLLFTQDSDLRFTWLYGPGDVDTDKLIGRTVSEIIPNPEEAEALTELKRRVLSSGVGERVVLPMSGGRAQRWWDLNVQPHRGRGGQIVGLVAAANDITWRVRHEDDNRAALARHEALLRELNHRIKNSLQLVASLLRLQAANLTDRSVLAVFDQACQRVTAVAEVHARLYMTENAGTLDFGGYLSGLLPRLLAAQPDLPERVEVILTAEGHLDVDQAIPMGLVANELVTNALRHAFHNVQKGRLMVGFRNDPDGSRFWVEDDAAAGEPLPSGCAKGPDGLGLRLVRALVEQVSGRFTTHRGPGTRCEVFIPAARP